MIRGLDKAVQGIHREAEALKARAMRVLRLAAREVYIDAKTKVPVRTGRLRDSITLIAESPFQYIVKAGSDTKTGAYYAPYVEFGTRKMAPRPFMRPAAEKARDYVERELR